MPPNLIQEIKSKINCRSMLDRFWPGNFKSNGNSICPLHADSPHKPSLAVYPDHVHCFGACGRSFDAIDLYEHGSGVSKGEAIRNLAHELGIQSDNGNRSPGKADKNPFIKRWKFFVKQPIPDEARVYLEAERGLKGILKHLEDAKLIGFNPQWRQYYLDPVSGAQAFNTKPALVFPLLTWKQDKLLGLQLLPLDRSEKRFAKGTSSKDAFFIIGDDLNQVIITEGIIDALSVFNAVSRVDRCSAVSILSCSGISKIKNIKSPGKILFLDDDIPGIAATIRALLEFKAGLAVVNYGLLPEGCSCSDPNELIQGGHGGVIERMVKHAKCPSNEGETKEFVTSLMDRMGTKVRDDQDRQVFEKFQNEINASPLQGISQGSTKDGDQSIKLEDGKIHRVVDDCLDLMRRDGSVFERGGELCRIALDEIVPVTTPWLIPHLTRIGNFTKYDKRASAHKRVDAPWKVAQSILEYRGLWGFAELVGVLPNPVMAPDGRILQQSGFDRETGLFIGTRFNAEEWKAISQDPSMDEIREALEFLWTPFKTFPFVDPIDRGVALAAVLTAVERQILPTAPGFIITAPSAASGKTLLALALGLLAGGVETFGYTSDDEELRKRFFATGRAGARCLLLDNWTISLGSDFLCSYLTSERVTDRVLGCSTTVSIPTRTLLVATGNNLQARGDLNRRVLRVNIDPQVELPYLRKFGLNPLEFVRKYRMKMVHSALILLKGVMSYKKGHVEPLASFEAWSTLIRESVLWIGEQGFLDVADPVLSIDAGYQLDPERQRLKMLMDAWRSLFGSSGGTSTEAVQKAGNDPDRSIFAALEEIASDRGAINTRRLGRWIDAREGQIVDGCRFERIGTRKHRPLWVVAPVSTACSLVGFDQYFSQREKNGRDPIPLKNGGTDNDTFLRPGELTVKTDQTTHPDVQSWIDEGLDDDQPLH